MITAKEAKEIQLASEANIQKYLTKVEVQIKECAELGLNRVALYNEGLYSSFPCGVPINTTPLQNRLITELQHVGFKAVFLKDGPSYIPKGLADDDGNGPIHNNWCVVVSW
jgi:hypothetical protein